MGIITRAISRMKDKKKPANSTQSGAKNPIPSRKGTPVVVSYRRSEGTRAMKSKRIDFAFNKQIKDRLIYRVPLSLLGPKSQ